MPKPKPKKSKAASRARPKLKPAKNSQIEAALQTPIPSPGGIGSLSIVPLPQKDVDLDLTREQITLLMMESFKKSTSSQEEIMCLKEVAKLNGMYDPKSTTTINVLNIEQNIRKLETMSDDELLKLAGSNATMFQKPDPVIEEEQEELVDQPIEGKCKEA